MAERDKKVSSFFERLLYNTVLCVTCSPLYLRQISEQKSQNQTT